MLLRLLKCQFGREKGRFSEALSMKDIRVANLALFIVSMGPSFVALGAGKLDSLRPIVQNQIIYARSRCDTALLTLLGIDRLPILARETRLAKLIMLEAHEECHSATATSVLARSRERAWVIRGRYLAKEVCTSCPRCKLMRRKLSEQLMADIPSHQLTPCPPFTHISLDFAGPYKAKAMGNSRCIIKLWGLVVICQNTRAKVLTRKPLNSSK